MQQRRLAVELHRSSVRNRSPESITGVWIMIGQEAGRPNTKMLIVDDDPLVLSALANRCTLMGFFVVTATNGLQALIKAGEHRPDVLVIDVHLPEVDGLSVLAYLGEAAKSVRHVVVISGRLGKDTIAACERLHAACILKGSRFWTDFETCLAAMYPEREADIVQSASRSAKVVLKQRPRILLVDDDTSVKKMFFHQYGRLGAALLHAADATRAFWMARHEQPTVIVSDFWMPNGDAGYLLTRLRSTPETCGIPVIVQSGRSLSNSVRRKLQEDINGHPGAARVLEKSFDGAELLEALQRFCGFATESEAQSADQSGAVSGRQNSRSDRTTLQAS
jgi:CheY-like chemotaxis protein